MQGNVLCNGPNSRCIMYQSRMRYLNSREGESRSSSRSGKRLIRGPEMHSFHSKKKPCSIERLLPPIELMTRERSLRYLSWKYNTKSDQIKKLDCLVNKKNHRDFEHNKEDWFDHNNKNDKGIDKINLGKEKEIRKNQNERTELLEVKNDGNQLLPLIVEQKRKNNVIRGRTRGSFIESAKVVKVSATLMKNRSAELNNKSAQLNDEISFGDSFSFLNDWRRESKRQGTIANFKKVT
jgi:hypothetical protein